MTTNNENNVTTWSASALCWKHRRLYAIVLLVCILLAVVVTVSIPKTYAASVKVADEPKEIDIIVGLNNYSAWIKQGMSKLNGKEGLASSEVYSKFMKSNSFMEQLSTIQIPNFHTDYYHYLLKHHKEPWWNSLAKRLSSLWSKPNEKKDIYDIIKNNVRSNYSNKYSTISIRVTDNDPEVAALLADSVKNRLQEQIINNRKVTAQADFINATKLKNQLEEEYLNAQNRYNSYRDSHFDGAQPHVKITLDMLKKERNRIFDAYSDAYEQYVRALILTHRDVSSFSVLKNVSVPLKPMKPILLVYILLFSFLGFVFTTWWILLKRLIKYKK